MYDIFLACTPSRVVKSMLPSTQPHRCIIFVSKTSSKNTFALSMRFWPKYCTFFGSYALSCSRKHAPKHPAPPMNHIFVENLMENVFALWMRFWPKYDTCLARTPSPVVESVLPSTRPHQSIMFLSKTSLKNTFAHSMRFWPKYDTF